MQKLLTRSNLRNTDDTKPFNLVGSYKVSELFAQMQASKEEAAQLTKIVKALCDNQKNMERDYIDNISLLQNQIIDMKMQISQLQKPEDYVVID